MATTVPDGLLVDESFDRFARLVRATLDVPVALVSFVERDRQVFRGAAGLPSPWAESRCTPLSHSFCRTVVADAAPVVVADARQDERFRDNPAIEDLGVVAYAGYPIVDGWGAVVGSLCAIDHEPRSWTPDELAILADLAEACSGELVLRTQRRRAEDAEQVALAASHTASVLLALSESLALSRTLPDVAVALHGIALGSLGALHAGIWTVRGGAARYVEHPQRPWPQAARVSSLALDDRNPVGHALTSRAPLYFRDVAEQDAAYPGVVPSRSREDGQARVFLPLSSPGGQDACLVVVWPTAREFDDADRTTLAALAAYTAQAVARATLLDERASVARTLQMAMLTSLPEVEGVELAARYLPAAMDELVGGDWYDVVPLARGTAFVIGDVVGHDIAAAAVMGQVRGLLRALLWQDASDPGEVLRRLDLAGRDLGVPAMATAALVVLERRADGGAVLRWAVAGHPAPVLRDPSGAVVPLPGDPDAMLGIVPGCARTTRELPVADGSTLVFFTDGLVETRDRHLDEGLALATDAVRRHGHREPGDLLDALVADVATDPRADDVALLAARLTRR